MSVLSKFTLLSMITGGAGALTIGGMKLKEKLEDKKLHKLVVAGETSTANSSSVFLLPSNVDLQKNENFANKREQDIEGKGNSHISVNSLDNNSVKIEFTGALSKEKELNVDNISSNSEIIWKYVLKVGKKQECLSWSDRSNPPIDDCTSIWSQKVLNDHINVDVWWIEGGEKDIEKLLEEWESSRYDLEEFKLKEKWDTSKGLSSLEGKGNCMVSRDNGNLKIKCSS
ncbi:hypothetical protein [Mycoplasma parvum]|nr:hypothetical protein [Mycoplasma parvum]